MKKRGLNQFIMVQMHFKGNNHHIFLLLNTLRHQDFKLIFSMPKPGIGNTNKQRNLEKYLGSGNTIQNKSKMLKGLLTYFPPIVSYDLYVFCLYI